MKTIITIILTVTLCLGFVQLKAQSPAEAGPKMLEAYFRLKNALVADNYATAKIEAKEMLDEVNTYPADKLDAMQRKTWMAYKDKLEYDSRHISEAPAIGHQREHFESLSKNIYEVVMGLKLNTATVYKDYCPMKKATWLSESVAVQNPYYGKQMLTCGKLTETIKSAKD